MRQNITIVYSVVNEKAWAASGNPIKFEHHGLSSHTVARFDAMERYQKMRDELERLKDVVGRQDMESIDEILKTC